MACPHLRDLSLPFLTAAGASDWWSGGAVTCSRRHPPRPTVLCRLIGIPHDDCSHFTATSLDPRPGLPALPTCTPSLLRQGSTSSPGGSGSNSGSPVFLPSLPHPTFSSSGSVFEASRSSHSHYLWPPPRSQLPSLARGGSFLWGLPAPAT